MVARREFDVIFVADPRLHGGVTKSIIEEVRAQHAAGYTTGLLPLHAPLKNARPVDPPLKKLIDSGALELLPPDGSFRTSLLLARGPVMFGEPQPVSPDVEAERAIVVVNAMPLDPSLPGRTHWDPVAISEAANEMFAIEWEWWPLSEVVRRVFQEGHPDVELSDGVWSNIIELDVWRAERQALPTRPYRVGRHSRDNPVKWPEDPELLLAAYPDDPELEIRILGGASTPERLIRPRPLPPNWTVQGFDAVSVQQFLASIDVFSFFHHSDWVEAFGRAPLEALASGAIAILPDYLEAVFGQAALYTTPDQAPQLIKEIMNDPEGVRSQRDLAWDVVRERFSYESHVERLRDTVGASSATGQLGHTDLPTRPTVQSDQALLFVTDSDAVVLCDRLIRDLSTYRVSVLDASDTSWTPTHDIAHERIPGVVATGLESEAWSMAQLDRMRLRLRQMQPELFVALGQEAGQVFGSLDAEPPHLAVWITTEEQAAIADFKATSFRFDFVFCPGWDTVSTNLATASPVISVGRLLHLPHDESLQREDARQELGLADSETAVLVDPGKDSRRDTWIERVASRLEGRDVAVWLAEPSAFPTTGLPDDWEILSPAESAKLIPGFDLAVARPSLYRLTECLSARLPTVYVGGDVAAKRRATMLVQSGVALSVASLAKPDAAQVLHRGLDTNWRLRSRSAASAWQVPDGYAEVTRVLAGVRLTSGTPR